MFSEWFVFSKAFPTSLIILDVGASLVYAFYNDWRRAIYWFAAAILTTTVTF
jgi:hypothetical protein